MPKWCYGWPHCACGIEMAKSLQEQGQKLLVFKADTGDIRRVPVSELLTLAIVEGEGAFAQLSAGCPEARGGDGPES